MIRYLIQRPIAILITFTSLVIAGLLVVNKIPVSLLPNVDVPKILITVNLPNTQASVLEANVLKPLRESLINTTNLQSIESNSSNHVGMIYMTFEFSTKMNLAYIEINEKIDRLTNIFPVGMQRPQVIRVNTSDIPIIRLQVVPKASTPYFEISNLSDKILRKRLEQIDGVSLVDINGKQNKIITITPDNESLEALGVDKTIITDAIQKANREIGTLNVKDNQYRYFVKLTNTLRSDSAIADLPIRLPQGTVIALKKVAKVTQEFEVQNGYHLYNGFEGLVITIQKQPESRMPDLIKNIKNVVNQFRVDYPQVDFYLTQDQTFLIDAGISNLNQDLIFGGGLAILLLFLFLGNWRTPTLMSISVPLSLIITFLCFYIFKISFNIISLSGLALGIGMLIDNSIVVVDSISRKRNFRNVKESSIEGTNEVITPVLSQVLTTVAVYAPLIFLGGIAGVLVFDQAIGLTISLGVSLLVAFILAPFLYTLLFKNTSQNNKSDTILYLWILKIYHRMIDQIMKRKLFYFIITILIMPIGIMLGSKLPISALPTIEKKESLVLINWNSPIDAQENLRRTRFLINSIQSGCLETESDIGIKQFLLQRDNNSIENADIFYRCLDEKTKANIDEKVKTWIKQHYPNAGLQIIDAPNAFTQLFVSNTPYFEARFKSNKNPIIITSTNSVEEMLRQIPDQSFKLGLGLIKEPHIVLSIDQAKLAIHGVSKLLFEDALRQQFGSFDVTEIKGINETTIVRLKTDNNTLEEKLGFRIPSNGGVLYPLNYFASTKYINENKYVTADKSGEYKSIFYDKNVKNISFLQQELSKNAFKYGYSVDFTGEYFANKAQLNNLWFIFLIVLGLLYLILAIQYENLIQPLIVMLTIPLGITGGMFLLWITGGTLDLMAAIGFIVILGLIVDDPILKIEVLNRLEKQYASSGLQKNEELLYKMVHEAGNICLKPLLMVSLTTSMALLPVLFFKGIGNDLQKPLALVIIGGLTIGTFFTTWFIPLAYWYVSKWKIKNKS